MKKMLQQITALLVPRLESKGFKKRADGIFTKELADGFIGWLGLNHVTRPQGIEINPVVGIRCQELERVLSLIMGEAPHKYIPPTVSISLGYLMPEQRFQTWIFEREVDDNVLSDLSDAIYRFGIPFMEAHDEVAKIDTLLELLKFGHREHVIYRRPLTKWLLNDINGARQLCDDYCLELGQRDDMAAEQFKQFARGFDSMLKQVNA